MNSTADQYQTAGGVTVLRTVADLPYDGAIEPLLDGLDSKRGAVFASSYEYPGRYTRWDMGFVAPPLVLESRQRSFALSALNDRGALLLDVCADALGREGAIASLERSDRRIAGTVRESTERFSEEQRSRQPSMFSILRCLLGLFQSPEDPHLGFYGAFGYDLAFQFEPVRLRLDRATEQRDLVLYLPDELVIVDHRRERATRRRYDFQCGGKSTEALPRDGSERPYVPANSVPASGDHAPGEYAGMVRRAREEFRCGNLFEVVPGQIFFEPCKASPAEVFRRLRERNPAPYGFLINLGDAEYLVGASPEMYVRVEGRRVETCPISGTIARGRDPIGDASQILTLLNSTKDESELTMCTDVDRNDKSRVCEPGSVEVIGRRQIEMYSRLIHTVDHVVGTLRPEFDGLDAFLTHTWAVTVTGAPKLWAMQFIEDNEKSARAWYGGAVGVVGFDGNVNTGLTLRTIRIADGVAQVRAGATLLFDSDPDEEERETRTKASALLDAIRRPRGVAEHPVVDTPMPGRGKRILLVDHEDSFVHTLANYLRQTGAEVVTLRSGFDVAEFDRVRPQLVVLSPGPGTPSDFRVSDTIAAAIARGLPVFGVCLGLQGMVEHFGGKLGVLGYPMHGKPSSILVRGGKVFAGMEGEFTAARYHSLYALRDEVPACLEITAETSDGVVMAVEHRELRCAAVQFHPESILTLGGGAGIRLIRNVVQHIAL